MKTKLAILSTLAACISILSLSTFADSDIRLVNNTDEPLQAIWQASGCADAREDWTGDDQFTVCQVSEVYPGESQLHTFNSFQVDRSMKVFAQNRTERIGYCNSMDDETITVSYNPQGNFIVKGC